jgi:sterol desaturase/sphingolipid hydroxylase (fatty acid hydroxylase superfamily)
MGFPHLLLYASPLFLFMMWLEHKLSHHSESRLYTRQDFITNIIIGIGDLVIGMAMSAFVLFIYFFCYRHFSPYRMSYLGFDSMGWGVGAWALAILADDFTYYWFHRTSHRIRVLWACHIVHHNSDHFNLSTAVRNGWIAIMYKPLYWCWMAALGFPPFMILSCLALNATYQFFCHTEMLSPWDKLSGFLNTPGLHAIHHGKEAHCIDKNYSGIFIFYDRIFGTYQPIDPCLKITFGVTHPPRRNHFIEVTIHEFRDLFRIMKSAPTLNQGMLHMLKGPDWKPDRKSNVNVESRSGPIFISS